MPPPRRIDMLDARELDAQQRHWYEVWKDAKAKADHYAKIAADAKGELKDQFGHATALLDGKPVFQIVRSKTKRFDTARFKEENPEDYDAYRVEGETVSLFEIQEADGEGVTSGE